MLADLIELSAFRRDPTRTPHTVILSLNMQVGDEEIIRHLGINDGLSLSELSWAINICFGLAHEQPPCSFSYQGDNYDLETCIHTVLNDSKATIAYCCGLWTIDIEVIDIIIRDQDTPDMLCIGGCGAPSGTFDLSAINQTLTGTQLIDEVLSTCRAEVRALIRRSGLYDFVSLFQAMDIAKYADSRIARAQLPLEKDVFARDCFFAYLLAQSCFSDESLTAEIAESIIVQLGHTHLSYEKICECAAASISALEKLSAGKSILERLDIYRGLLARLR
ncbi:Uncharacterised protein [Corynebacterium kutscheri]|uniref:Uncharacterized protein n=1 Tax=Corynebacterium kutscheri TaxID=35755 RepID=A0A0F6TBW0_9CORY|nr:hypothetical protein [Corynebacterium kutscheri]AKE40316.1 hypothetical protein UL82_00365 [Corynebacterium kutscheri]VEH05452.1 Uncharacterised protein [Corynebacterium kutscheri]VEH10709.1 Uncharacterised protein [Corynebacterium kutscheri]VEH80805.1 Uncharacterised protein [Corynebacterium kutscheri]